MSWRPRATPAWWRRLHDAQPFRRGVAGVSSRAMTRCATGCPAIRGSGLPRPKHSAAPGCREQRRDGARRHGNTPACALSPRRVLRAHWSPIPQQPILCAPAADRGAAHRVRRRAFQRRTCRSCRRPGFARFADQPEFGIAGAAGSRAVGRAEHDAGRRRRRIRRAGGHRCRAAGATRQRRAPIGTAFHPRHMIRLEPGARLTLLEIVDRRGRLSAQSGYSRCMSAAGAVLTHVRLQDESAGGVPSRDALCRDRRTAAPMTASR